MKVVILAGGYGTRISEESHLKPKPMIEIGEMPILWHIMKGYSFYGFNEFIICCGYKGYVIKEWFADYFLHMSDVTFDFADGNRMVVNNNVSEPWKVTLIDTGEDSMTGYRIKKIQDYIPKNESFMMTYGDGVSDVNICNLVHFHEAHRKIATMTTVQPSGRFGMVDVKEDGTITEFVEKPQGDGGWINAGFMVLNYEIFRYLNEDKNLMFEKDPMIQLVREKELVAYKHYDFWQPMDTLRDKVKLNDLWKKQIAPWKVWD